VMHGTVDWGLFPTNASSVRYVNGLPNSGTMILAKREQPTRSVPTWNICKYEVPLVPVFHSTHSAVKVRQRQAYGWPMLSIRIRE
jgi:hypothetical protein